MPDWLDTTLYPFTSRYADTPEGRLHYVDEGSGEPIVMMHGIPTWSFLYRHLINGLRDRYRLIAPDQPGFGLSDKPPDYSYLPAAQAHTIAGFIDDLGLPDLTLMVHDFGGPIGLAYALQHPERIRRLIIFNTWLWPLQSDRQMAVVGRILGSPLGRWLYLHANFELNVIFPSAYGDRSRLTPAIRAHYQHPMDDRTARRAVWVYTRELLRSQVWYSDLWSQHHKLRDIPTLILWGLEDPVFGPAYLERWQAALPHAQTITFADTGHYVQEEQASVLVPIVDEFMTRTGSISE